jgi:hypothetical protein
MSFLFNAAHHAILPGIVRDDQLIEANGHLKAAESVSEGAAFASGGWLIEWLSAPVVLGVDALSYAISGMLLWGVKAREPDRPMDRSAAGNGNTVLAEAREGLSFLARHPLQRPTVPALCAGSMSWSIASTVYLLYVYEELGFTPGVLGMVFAVGAFSSVAGALTAQRATAALGLGWTMVWTLLGFGAATMLLGLAIGGTLGETLELRATLMVAGGVGLLGAVIVSLSALRGVRDLEGLSRP